MALGTYTRVNDTRMPFFLQYFLALWRYRHLALNLVGSDLRSRFRRSYLGIVWGALQPLGFATTIAYVLHVLFNQPFSGFFVYVLSGFILWDWFVTSINVSLSSLEAGAGYLRQARVPLFVFQARAPLGGLINFGLGLVSLFLALVATGLAQGVGLHLLLIAPFAFLMLVFTFALSIIFSLIGTQYRDIGYIVPIALQLVFLMSPVILPRDLFGAPHLAFLQLANPIIPLLDMFRATVLRGEYWSLHHLVAVLIWIAVLWLLALALALIYRRDVVFRL